MPVFNKKNGNNMEYPMFDLEKKNFAPYIYDEYLRISFAKEIASGIQSEINKGK